MLCDDPTLPNAIVRGFADAQPGADEFFRQFLPVVSSRSVGMLFDAQNDKAFNDYTDKAKRLFSRCLAADDLDALLSSD